MQKCQVYLPWLAWQNPHVVFLDKPANHLDIKTIDTLADTISEFEGGMMLVSHNFRLCTFLLRIRSSRHTSSCPEYQSVFSSKYSHCKVSLIFQLHTTLNELYPVFVPLDASLYIHILAHFFFYIHDSSSLSRHSLLTHQDSYPTPHRAQSQY